MKRLAALFLLVAHASRGSGLGIPDLGASALGQAGATVARPGDLSAIYYNPAGLAGQEGIGILLDGRAVRHEVTFQRLTADGTNPAGFFSVTNSNPPRVAPVLGVSWHGVAYQVPYTLALGGFPSNGTTGYQYPDPSALRASGSSDNDITRLAPQRYSSIESTSKTYTATLAAGARVLPWLDLGVGLQAGFAFLSSRQAVSASPVTGEYPGFDAIVRLSAQDLFRPSAIFGASAQLPLGLVAGASYQLPLHFHASGSLTAELPPSAASLGAAIHGDRIEADVVFPWVARAGLRLIRGDFELELAGTIEGWSSLREIRITPMGIDVEVLGKSSPLPPLVLHKELRNAGSLRLGGQWRALSWLTLRAGVLGETSAVPEERQALDDVHWQRLAGTLGASARYRNLEFTLAYAHFLQPTRQVRDSQVTQVSAFASVPPTVIGNGDFSSQIDLLAAAVEIRF